MRLKTLYNCGSFMNVMFSREWIWMKVAYVFKTVVWIYMNNVLYFSDKNFAQMLVFLMIDPILFFVGS